MTSISVPTYPNADDMLTAFFTLRGEALRGRRAQRHAAAEQALRRCCEAHLEEYLNDTERFLVGAERQVDPIDAATRLVNPELLLAVLPHFIRELRDMCRDLEDWRVRLTTAERFRNFLISFPPLHDYDGSCDDIEITIALRRSKAELDRARALRRQTAA